MSASRSSDLDTPTHRTLFTEMDLPAREAMLEAIRDRRLAPLRVYEELQAKRKEVKDEKLAAKAKRLSEKMAKKLMAAAQAVDEAEELIKQVKAIQIEMECE